MLTNLHTYFKTILKIATTKIHFLWLFNLHWLDWLTLVQSPQCLLYPYTYIKCSASLTLSMYGLISTCDLKSPNFFQQEVLLVHVLFLCLSFCDVIICNQMYSYCPRTCLLHTYWLLKMLIIIGFSA